MKLHEHYEEALQKLVNISTKDKETLREMTKDHTIDYYSALADVLKITKDEAKVVTMLYNGQPRLQKFKVSHK